MDTLTQKHKQMNMCEAEIKELKKEVERLHRQSKRLSYKKKEDYPQLKQFAAEIATGVDKIYQLKIQLENLHLEAFAYGLGGLGGDVA